MSYDIMILISNMNSKEYLNKLKDDFSINNISQYLIRTLCKSEIIAELSIHNYNITGKMISLLFLLFPCMYILRNLESTSVFYFYILSVVVVIIIILVISVIIIIAGSSYLCVVVVSSG